MNKTILAQLNIDVAKLLDDVKGESSLSAPIFEAKLTASATNSNKAALLQVNIVEDTSKLEATLELIQKEFAAVTIFIDMQLARLAYRIILPYMSEEQIQNIATRRKLDWLANNMTTLKKMAIPCSIVTDNEASIAKAKDDNLAELRVLLESNDKLRKNITADNLTLKAYLADTHNIIPAQYQQELHNYDSIIENYLITKTATIAAIHSCSHYEYVYIAPYTMHSYTFLQQTATLQSLPQHLALSFTKIAENNEQKLLTSTELNQQLHDHDLLNKISERKSYLENSIKHFPGNVYLQSTDYKTITCNKQQGLTIGISDESYLIGKTPAEFCSKEDADAAADILTDIVTTNTTKIITESFVFSGKEYTYLSIKTPIRNKKNKTIGIIGFSLKMNDVGNMEKSKSSQPQDVMQTIVTDKPMLHAGTANLIKSMEHMPGHTFWQDTKGKILGCNYNHALFLGFDSPLAVIGKHANEFLTDEHALESKKALAKIVNTGKPVSKEETYQSGNSFIRMISHKTPIKDSNGKVIGIIVIAIEAYGNNQHQMQLEQEKEQLEIASSFKNKFIETIGHDMRAPILGLYNMTELCAAQETDPEKKQRLYEISSCAKDLLKFSSSISGANSKNLVSIKDSTNSVISSHITAIQTKHLKFKLDYDNNIPDTVVGDVYNLQKTINNLMASAICHSKQGYITLAIKLESHKGNELEISFTMFDSGAIISKEEQQYIFSQYNTLNSSQV